MTEPVWSEEETVALAKLVTTAPWDDESRIALLQTAKRALQDPAAVIEAADGIKCLALAESVLMLAASMRPAVGVECIGCQQVFTEEDIRAHVITCDQHPIRAERNKLRKALADLVGASTLEELNNLEGGLRMTSIGRPDADTAVALNAVHVLREIQ